MYAEIYDGIAWTEARTLLDTLSLTRTYTFAPTLHVSALIPIHLGHMMKHDNDERSRTVSSQIHHLVYSEEKIFVSSRCSFPRLQRNASPISRRLFSNWSESLPSHTIHQSQIKTSQEIKWFGKRTVDMMNIVNPVASPAFVQYPYISVLPLPTTNFPPVFHVNTRQYNFEELVMGNYYRLT